MMDGAGNNILITGALSLITLAIKFLFTKYSAQKSKNRDVLEEQYLKVFAPLHKLIFYKRSEDSERLNHDIDQIIASQYHLIPQQIIKTYLKWGTEADDDTSFEDYIDKCYNVIAAKLGYTQVTEKFYTTKSGKLFVRLRNSNDVESILDTLNKANNIVFAVSFALTIISIIASIIYSFMH